MEIFRLFGTISINKAKAIADIKAVNAAGATFGTKFRGVLTKIAKVGKLVFAGLAVAAGAMFVGAIKKAAAFELGMAKVKAITGATAEEFDALTEKAKELGLETAQTMTEIAEGMEAFARAGFTATEIVIAMDGAVALAESQVMGLGDAVRITGAVLNGMNLEVEESTRVANALAATASSSATNVGTLAESMKFLAPVAASMNMSLEETLTVVAKLGDAGLRGGRATRALATAIRGLAKPTDEAAEALERLGIETFDAEGNFVGIIDLVGQLEESFAELGLTSEQKMEAMVSIFAGASNQMNILIAATRTELELYQDSITGTQTAFEQQAAMLDTVSGQWQILKGSIELLMVTIGSRALPVIQSFVTNTLIPWVNRMTDAAGGTSLFEEAMNKLIAPFQWMIDNGQKVKNALLGIAAGLAAVMAINMTKWVLTLGGALSSLSPAVLAALIALGSLYGIFKGGQAILAGVEDGVELVADQMKNLASMINPLESGMISLESASKSLEDRMWLLATSFESLVEAEAMTQEQADAIMEKIQEMYDQVKDAPDLYEILQSGNWDVAMNNILAQWSGDVPELLRLLVDVSTSVDNTSKSTATLDETIDNARAAIIAMNQILAMLRGETDETTADVSALRKEYDNLIIALGETEKGSYEYALALQNLEKFHNALAAAAEYLAEGDEEVGIELQKLIDLTMKYYREQDKATESAKKGARTMEDLKDAFVEMQEAMSGAEVGSLEWSDALGDVQSQADNLMNIVDFLQEKNIKVSQSIWDQIDALDAQGATIRKTAKETERLTDEQEKLEKAQDAAKRAAEEHARSIKEQAKALLNLAVTAIKDVVNAYKKMRQEAEDYAQTMRDIQEEFKDREIEDAEDKADALEEANLRLARNMADIDTDYARDKADLRAKDFEDANDYIERLAKIEEDYQRDKQDERLSHQRTLEDIDTNYTEAVEENIDRRVESLEEERQQFLENRTTIFTVFEDLKTKVAEYAAERVIENWIDGIADSWAGVATETTTAASVIDGFTTTSAPSLVTGLLNIGKALVPLLIGFGAFNDEIRSANESLTGFFSSFGVGSETYGVGTWRTAGDPAGGGAPYYDPAIQSGEQPYPAAQSINVAINYGGVTVLDQHDAEILAQETYDLYMSRLRSEGVTG